MPTPKITIAGVVGALRDAGQRPGESLLEFSRRRATLDVNPQPSVIPAPSRNDANRQIERVLSQFRGRPPSDRLQREIDREVANIHQRLPAGERFEVVRSAETNELIHRWL